MRAAVYMHVKPWELERISVVWQNRALLSQSVENWAENEHMKRATKKGKKQ